MSAYRDALREAMGFLAGQGALFLGQAVRYPGTAMSGTLDLVPEAQRIEMPVAEELQMGAALGLALSGCLPVSIFPRWSFVLRAADQLVNHLDRMPAMAGRRPRVIIRTSVPTANPLNPGPQHLDDLTNAFDLMLSSVRVVRLFDASGIVEAYHRAAYHDGSTLLVEYAAEYGS